MRIAIIGAGIGGLCTAIGLRAAGAQVEVFERAPVHAPSGSGISVFGNGVAAVRALGLGDAFEAIAARGGGFRGGQRRPDGRWLATIPSSALEDLRIVHRADLHRVLLEALGADAVRLGTTVTMVSADGRTIATERLDGSTSTATFDVVVAADGIRSRSRAARPDDPGVRYAGYSAWRGVTHEPVDLAGEAGETWGRDERFGMAPLADGRVYWFAVAGMPAGRRLPDEHAELRRRFGGWHRPIPELLGATDPQAVARHDIFDLAAPLGTFRRGRCVLLGDAAHAMTPDLGQGGGQAMEDAATLAALLAPVAADDEPPADVVDAALDRYDRERRARTQPIARRARAVGALAHIPPLLTPVRDALLRATPSGALARQIAAVQGWRPPQLRDVAPGGDRGIHERAA